MATGSMDLLGSLEHWLDPTLRQSSVIDGVHRLNRDREYVDHRKQLSNCFRTNKECGLEEVDYARFVRQRRGLGHELVPDYWVIVRPRDDTDAVSLRDINDLRRRVGMNVR